MNFAGALFALKHNHKVKRHHWTGYWHKEERVDGKPDDIFMHTWDGKEIKLTDTNDIFYTLYNCACDDWEIVEDWDKNTTQPDYMNDNCVTVEEKHMNNDYMIQRAKGLAAGAINGNVGKPIVTPTDMYVVWFCKTLQNWKALVSTSVLDSSSECGDYVEVTHNGDKKETYCDVYKKQLNVCYKDFEV